MMGLQVAAAPIRYPNHCGCWLTAATATRNNSPQMMPT
jgi:hypothetical protein